MSTATPTSQASGSRGRDAIRLTRLREENRALLDQLRSLRTALEMTARENGELRREVARLAAENQHLRGVSRSREARDRAGRGDRIARIRVMLQDQHSRNP